MGKRKRTDHWQVFIDETGDFAARERDRAIVGLVVRTGAAPGASPSLRAAVASAAGGVPYPHHASEHAQPAGRLLAMLRPEATSLLVEGSRLSRLRSDGELALERCPLAAASRLMKAVRSSRRSSWDDRRAFDRWLRDNERGLWEALNEAARQDRSGLSNLLARLGEEQSVFLVAAVAGPGSDSGGEDGDAYLELLPALFERLGALLWKRVGKDLRQVWITLAQRHTSDSSTRRGRRPLILGEVHRAISAGIGHPPMRQSGVGGRRFRMTVAGLEAYDPDVSPGVVLADFAANRMRQALRSSARHAWTQLASRIADETSAPVAFEVEWREDGLKLPTMASDGLAAEAIRSAFAEQPGPTEGVAPGWALDQARAWIEAAS